MGQFLAGARPWRTIGGSSLPKFVSFSRMVSSDSLDSGLGPCQMASPSATSVGLVEQWPQALTVSFRERPRILPRPAQDLLNQIKLGGEACFESDRAPQSVPNVWGRNLTIPQPQHASFPPGTSPPKALPASQYYIRTWLLPCPRVTAGTPFAALPHCVELPLLRRTKRGVAGTASRVDFEWRGQFLSSREVRLACPERKQTFD